VEVPTKVEQEVEVLVEEAEVEEATLIFAPPYGPPSLPN
jgi:hypothetical protein